MAETSYAPDPRGTFTASREFDCECPGGAGLTGVGSPEGAVVAGPGTTYLDTSNNFFYAKGSGSGNTGWVLLIS